jgi:hypothetical protein
MAIRKKRTGRAAGKRASTRSNGSASEVNIVVVDPSAAVSPYGRKALKAFRDGVQMEF